VSSQDAAPLPDIIDGLRALDHTFLTLAEMVNTQ
jgi:hypothetical protein